nr:alcohol dehydrogenase catalytic domain-containing protein [Candidatus Sigynarchaeota archaeon]
MAKKLVNVIDYFEYIFSLLMLLLHMKAALLERVQKITVKDVPTPVATRNMLLVRVKACGICLTDYKAYSGERTNVTFPAICGHEFSGVVEQVGEMVTRYKKGDEVIVAPVANCGTCPECRRGFAQYCKNGAVIGGDGMPTIIDGAFAEHVLVPEIAVYAKPPNVSFEAAALT